MARPIRMPKLSDEMTEGKLSRWLMKEGVQVRPGDVVALVETGKATLDVEAFDRGILLRITVREGETAPVGATIAWVGERGEKVPAPGEGLPEAARQVPSGSEVAEPVTKTAPRTRVIDGAAGARFLRISRRAIDPPLRRVIG